MDTHLAGLALFCPIGPREGDGVAGGHYNVAAILVLFILLAIIASVYNFGW